MSWLEQLNHLKSVKERKIIGIMSGTSMDGLDIGLCNVSGTGSKLKAYVEAFECYPFSKSLEEGLKNLTSRPTWDAGLFTRIHAHFSVYTVEKVQSFLDELQLKPSDVHLISFHGHTAFHIPNVGQMPARTFQLGEADHLAHLTGIPVMSDFRQKHIAAGGEGAPLARYLDELLFRDQKRYRALVNLGGMGNITVLPPQKRVEAIFTSDTGPANKLLDLAYRKWTGKEGFDQYGSLAASGKSIDAWLKCMLTDEFIQKSGPKSTGAEYFNLEFIERTMQEAGVYYAEVQDILKTLVRFSAVSIADMIKKHVPKPEWHNMEVILSGGGVHNITLRTELFMELSDCIVMDSGVLGVPAEAKESLLFAVLANESFWGKGLPLNNQLVRLGKLSLP